MSFLYYKFMPAAVVLVAVLCFYVMRYEGTFFSWVKDNWFYSRSLAHKISTVFFLVGFSLLIISCLDFRGKGIKIEGLLSDQKTVIMIDSSSSMLVKDVRPNRFERAVVLARHFIKNAAGHQISVVLFSDFQKQIVPFTDDIDVLDARLKSLDPYSVCKGGTNLSRSLQESLAYFEGGGNKSKVFTGNILLITDAEVHDSNFSINIPKTISVGVVGIGTEKGGVIPVRNNSEYVENKKYNGEDIISKFNPRGLTLLSEKISNYKFWRDRSHSLQTDDVISFFRTKFSESNRVGSMYVRPAYSTYISVLGIISLIICYILRMFTSKFTHSLLVLFALMTSFLNGENAFGNEDHKNGLKQASVKKLTHSDEEVFKILMPKFKKGILTKKERLKLGELFLKKGKGNDAVSIYSENSKDLESLADEELFNYGTSLLKNGNVKKGISILANLISKLKGRSDDQSQKMLNDAKKNILFGVKSKKQNKDQKNKQDQKQNKDQKNKQDQKQNKDQKNKQDQKQNKDQKNKQDQKQNKDQKNKQNQKQNRDQKNKQDQKQNKDQKNKQDQKQNKDQKNKQDQKKNKDQQNKQDQKKNKDQKDIKKDKDKSSRKRSENVKEREDRLKKERMERKVPAFLNQILNNDRELQGRVFDTSSSDKSSNGNKKDW